MLIYAKPPTNSDFEHSIPVAKSGYRGIRISLTFRNVEEIVNWLIYFYLMYVFVFVICLYFKYKCSQSLSGYGILAKLKKIAILRKWDYSQNSQTIKK